MIRQEIGSFFEQMDTCSQKKQSGFKYKQRYELVSCGRQAIELALQDIENREINTKRCMLPIYTCDTVIDPFKKNGWDIFFYRVNYCLQVDKEYFLEQLNSIKPTVLFMHTYYGSDTIKNVRDEVKKAQNEWGMIFIEDMTQSLGLLEKVTGADYYVGSLRKWFAIPDGGFVFGKEELFVDLKGENHEFVQLKKQAQQQKREYLDGNEYVKKAEFLTIHKHAEELLYKQNEIFAMSDFSKEILDAIDIQEVLKIRTRNGQYLENQVRTLGHIKPVLSSKAEGYLYYPVYVKDRQKLQSFLKNQDIYAPVLWPVDPLIENKMDDVTRYIYEHLIALPCDQRYTLQDMERISLCLREFDSMQEKRK